MDEQTKVLQKAKQGDRKAFDALMRATARELFWYCRRLTGNETDADDLLQEVYLTAWQKLSQFQEEGSFSAWLRTVARRKWYNCLRKEQPTPAEQTEELPEDELCGPEYLTEQKLLGEALLRAMDEALSEIQRMTVLLYYYDQKNISQIASEMGCSEGTVRSRLYYARQKLREAMEKKGYQLSGSIPLLVPVLRESAAKAGLPRVIPGSVGGTDGHFVGRAAARSVRAKLLAGAGILVIGGGGVLAYHSLHKPPTSPRSDFEASNEMTVPAGSLPVPTIPPTLPPETVPETETAPVEMQSGGDLVVYSFLTGRFDIGIPENYSFSDKFLLDRTTGPGQFGHDRTCVLRSTADELARVYPDDGSGDCILIGVGSSAEEQYPMEETLQSQFDSVSLTETQELEYPVNMTTYLSNVPLTASAQRTAFTAELDGKSCNGFAIRSQLMLGETPETSILIFCDHSGTRAEEFAEIEASLTYIRGSTTMDDLRGQ